jgi:large subunit ribosomal protein L10
MRLEKQSMIEELRRKLTESSFVILTDYKGVDVAKMNDLRDRLRTVKAHLQVVQNRMFQRLARDLNYPGFDERLRGPSAMVFGAGDVVAAAKVLKDFIKENEKPALKVGVMQGIHLSKADVERLASLPSREYLLAQLVGLLASPLRQVVGVMHQRLASLVYVLKAYQENKQKA